MCCEVVASAAVAPAAPAVTTAARTPQASSPAAKCAAFASVQATVEATGLSRDELIGTSFSEYFTEPDKADQLYQLVLTDGMTEENPLTMRHRNGALTEVRYNASVYRDAEDKVLGVFAAARDVTKQMEAQAETADLEGEVLERQAELERLQQRTVGREVKMYELKKENESLRKRVLADDEDPEDGQ